MKLSEIIQRVTPVIGKTYTLRNDKKLGDYSDFTVTVEAGPRNAGTDSEQYRVSWGTGSYDVDWIDTFMFDGATLKD